MSPFLRSTPRSRRITAVALSCLLASAAGSAFAQSCHPAALRSDPSSGDGKVVVRVAGDFPRGGGDSRTVQLRAGESYWFAASGCPRTDDVALKVTAPGGGVVFSEQGHTTGGCVKATKTGTYRVSVKAVSLRPGNDWGSIAAEGSRSNCEPAG